VSDAFGFLLITVDPLTTHGGPGSAWDLVVARLAKRMWPIYANTRNRQRFGPGRRVAFYIGGERKHAGEVIATALVSSVESWTMSKGSVDPDRYLTEPADQVLRLDQISRLTSPVRLKDYVSKMSFAPSNMGRWGVVLMGGCRALSHEDWRLLFLDR
jgi:hypothetical protein